VTDAAEKPFCRNLDIAAIPPDGTHIEIEATQQECAALARDMKLPSIERLSARLSVVPEARGVYHVTGEVRAALHRVCVVTAESFSAALAEPVDIRFAPPETAAAMAREVGDDLEADDPPDPYENGRIDLGVVAAEFMALGLDPYPRKPGAVFAFTDPKAGEISPFAGLASLTRKPD